MYQCLLAFHDLRWRGKPDRQIGATHWQEWLQADAQRDSRVLHPRPRHEPSMRRPRAARCRRTRFGWPTYPSTRRWRAPSGSRCCSLRQGGPRNQRNAPNVRTSTTQAGQCWNTWRGTRCTLPPQWKTRRWPPKILQGRTRRSPWHAPYAQRPPPEAAGHAAAPGEEEEASDAAPGAGGEAHQGSVPARLAPLTPLWGPLGAGSPHPMAPAHPGDLAAPADPAAMPARDS